MATTMRAKMRVGSVFAAVAAADSPRAGEVISENVTLFGVSKSTGYPADGSDEDNTYARFSPSVRLDITIANPALLGALKTGDTFYVDFTPVD